MTTDPDQAHARAKESTPAPDDPRKPSSPQDLHKPTWRFVLRSAVREFVDDQCTDVAAALTFWSVLALFPAAIALLSVLGVVGQADAAIRAVEDVLRPLLTTDTADRVVAALEGIAASDRAGTALVLGLLGALWSASGYVNAFGRAMNRIYEIREGRPLWLLRPAMILITVLLLTMMAAVLLIIAATGPVARALGDALGVGGGAVLVWEIAKWPVALGLAVLVIALLYYATPNVKQPTFRWMSVGAFIALLVAVAAVAAFGLYAATLGSYDATYGSLAGAIVVLLDLFLVNLALLFGAELDSELERGRELQAGMPAEEELQLPARSTRGIERAERRRAAAVERAREVRGRGAEAEERTGSHQRTEQGDGARVEQTPEAPQRGGER